MNNCWPNRQRRKVLVTGVFDVCHIGHVRLLKEAAAYGRLLVGLNDDESVRSLKGPKRPINNERDRIEFIMSFECVSDAFLIHSVNVADAIRENQPGFWVKGSDYTIETLNKHEVAAANEVGAKIIFARLHTDYSTTYILRQLEAMSACTKCGTNFVGTAANPPGPGLCIYCQLGELKIENIMLRKALVSFVGVDGREDLDAMEKQVRSMPADSENQRIAIASIEALRRTLPAK